jgi:hypothetical protein
VVADDRRQAEQDDDAVDDPHQILSLRMILSENRDPLFGIMR